MTTPDISASELPSGDTNFGPTELATTTSNEGGDSLINARRISPTPATAAKTVEMRAVPRVRVVPATPRESPVSPLVAPRSDSVAITNVGNGVPSGTTGGEVPQFPMAIPVQLWRANSPQPATPQPVVVVPSAGMSPLLRVAAPSASSPGGNVQVQGAAVKVVPSVLQKNAAPPKGTVFVVKKMENGRTVITAQEVPGNASVKKIAREVIAASNAQVRTLLPAPAKPPVSAKPPLPAKPPPPAPRADPPRVITVPDEKGAFVTIKHNSKTGTSETRVIYPRKKSAAESESKKEVSVATQTASNGKSVAKSKNPPAVVHVVPVVEPAKTASRPPNILECVKVSDKLVCLKSPVTPKKVQEHVQPEKSSGGDDIGKTLGGCYIKQEPPETVEDACSQPEEESGGWDIKISNVFSLAGREEDMHDPDQVALCADINEGGEVGEVAQSAVPVSVHTDKKTAEKAPEVKETLFSMCKLREVEGDSENESIELCSFQTTKGNSVMGSQIVFKPAPGPSNGGKDSSPGSKVEKLKQAIKLFEESTLQDSSLFGEKEKVMLTSLFRRFKDDALADDSKPGPSNVKSAAATKSPDKSASDPEVRGKTKSPADKKSNGEGGGVQAEPESRPETQPAKNGQLPVAPHKPLRRIVITSDQVPVMTSEEIKAGIETFLVANNISNNFCADEIIKLHWDGEDTTSFHFRETDSPPVQVPPRVVRPTILRTTKKTGDTPGKDVAGPSSAGPSGAAGTSAEPKAGTSAEPKAGTSAQQSKADLGDVKQLSSNFKPVRLKYMTDTGQIVDQVVIKAVKALPALSGGAIQSEKQLAFVPRAIRYVKKTGEVVEQPVNPEQQVVPVYSSGHPAGANPSPGNTTSSAQVRSLLPPAKSVLCVQPIVPTGESLKRLLDAARNAAPSSASKKAEKTSVVASTANCRDGGAPTVAPRPVAAKKTEAKGHKSGSLNAAAINGPMSGRQAYEAALLASRMPPSSAESDDAARLFEPEVLLEESNSVIEVKPLEVQGQLDTSSDETTTSSDDEDYVPPFKKPAPSPKRPPPEKKTSTAQKTAAKKTPAKKTPAKKTATQGSSTRKRKRSHKRDTVAPAPSAAPSPDRSKRVLDVSMLSSNCIDRPCVVDMRRLNDRLLSRGFVDLSAVGKGDDLFVLADSPEVMLSSDKVVSVVELKPRASSTLLEEQDRTKQNTDAVARLLREQKKELVQLRRRYKKPNTT